MSTEIYVSIDVESNGPIPPDYSMLSLGAAAYDENGGLISKFSVNLEELKDAKEDPDTIQWWSTQFEAWKACRKNRVDPIFAMTNFVAWVKKLGGKPVCVAYPAGFDWMFVYWYLIHFVGYSPFSFSCLDIKSYVAGHLGIEYKKASKRNMPKRWFPEYKHTHVAVDDAVEQGTLFCNIMKEARK